MLFVYSRNKIMTKNWKKILPTCLSYFLEHVPLSEGTGKGGSTCQPKSFNFPLIAFRQILAKTLRAACIQLDNYDLLEEAWLKLSPLIQNCPAGLSTRIIYQVSPFLPKMSKIVAPVRCGLFPTLPLNLYGRLWGWEEILPNSQKFTHFPHQKNPP